MKVLGLVDAFILAMGAELLETDITTCWDLWEGVMPIQKKDGPFSDVIMFLD